MSGSKDIEEMTCQEKQDYFTDLILLVHAELPRGDERFMVVILQDNGEPNFGSTMSREESPQALRELADRIESRTTVKR